MTVPSIPLHDGTSIPQLGFGVFQVEPERTAEVVQQALDVGYRHLDTAQMYGNEAGVGEALRASGVARDDVYVTTKLSNAHHRPDDADRSLDDSLTALGVDQVDLFLVHWPLPTQYGGDFVSTWRAMAGFLEDGRARSIGVSNFQPDHLERIVTETGVVPVVNQIEVHPFFGNEVVREADRRHSIVTQAWSPIAQGKVNDDARISEIAADLDRTNAQVALRWHLQRGDVVFPKSVNVDRMRQNFALFDFELSADQMAALDAMDRGADGRLGPDPDTFDMIPG